jgi:FMN phosphatase YigB (HAD superfamily)
MVKWIIFDAMGVVYTVGDDTRELLVPYVKSLGSRLAEEAIESCYEKAMVGEISGRDFWSEVGLSHRYPECEEKYLGGSFSVSGDFLSLVEEISGKYKVGMISNDVDEWSKAIRMATGVDSFFDCVVTSSAVRVRKPVKEIYLHFARLAGADPGECMFIDDKESNVRGAVEAGMKGIYLDRKGVSDVPEGIPVIRSLSELRVK